jgi:exopolysaccharide biosynthesis WecB/TagA/CpsF family protein
MHETPPADFLGLRFDNATLTEAAQRLTADAASGRPGRVFFINAHCINVASRDAAYSAALSRSTRLFADGVGMAMAARLWGVSLRDNVNGTDLFPVLCENAARKGVPLALLGARPGIAEQCARRMQERHPGLRIAWTHHGFYPPEDEDRIIREINRSGARILLVAKGVPLQELWIDRHAARLCVPVLMGVGALFDFYSGAMPRCPRALRSVKLEWLFRFLHEPRRLFGRYIVGNPLFLCRILGRRLSSMGQR